MLAALGAGAAALQPAAGSAESALRDCGATAGYQLNAPWPGRSRCPTGIGQSPYEGPNDAFVAFQPTVGTVLRGAAVAADGSIYVGNSSGQLFKFSSTGVQLWRRDSLGGIRNTPAIATDGTVYVATDAGYLRAINPSTGATKWSSLMSNGIRSYANVPMHGSPVIAPSGVILVSNDAGLLQAVNPNGSRRWTLQGPGPVYMTVALSADGQTVYVGSVGFALAAFDIATGATRWTSTLPIGSGPAAVSAEGTIYVPSSIGLAALWAVDPSNGALIGGVPLGITDVFDKSPSLGPEGNIVIGNDQGVIVALSRLGNEIWRRSFGSSVRIGTAAIDASGNVYFAASDGMVRALRGDTGATIWQYAAGGNTAGLPAINGSNQLIVPINGKLMAFGRAGRWGALDDPPPPFQPQAPGVASTTSLVTPPPGGPAPIPPVLVQGGIPSLTRVDDPRAGVTASVTENRTAPNTLGFLACTVNSAGLETPITDATLKSQLLSNQKPAFSSLRARPEYAGGCQAIAAPSTCPIDPASFAQINRTCTTDSNCPNGAICAFDCGVDGGCDNAVKRCGRPLASCQPLPQISATVPFPPDSPPPTGNEAAPCIEIRQCTIYDGGAHHPYEEGKQFLDCVGSPDRPGQDTSSPPDGFPDVDPDCNVPKDTPPPPPAPAESPFRIGDICKLAQENPGARQANNFDQFANFQESAGRPPDTLTKKWDLSVSPFAIHTLSFAARPFGRSLVQSTNQVRFVMQSRLYGKDFKIFDLDAHANLQNCDIDADASAKLLGDLIDIKLSDNTSFLRSVTDPVSQSCVAVVNTAENALNWAKSTMVGAKNALGTLKPDLRNPLGALSRAEFPSNLPLPAGVTLPTVPAVSINAAIPTRAACQAATAFAGALVTPQQCSANYAVQTAVNTANTYINAYNGAMIQASNAVQAERDRLLSSVFSVDSGPVVLVDAKQQFRVTLFAITFPIGPIPLNLSLETSGHYGVSGELQYAAHFVEGNGQPPGVSASLRAGPFAGISLLAFVGIGFDLAVFEARVGIQGSLTLVEIRVPLFAGIGLRRGAPIPDTRPPLQTATNLCGPNTPNCGFGAPFAVPNVPIPSISFNPVKYRWDLYYNMGAEFRGSALSGSVDIAARVRFLFFSVTYRKQLAKLKGFSLNAKFMVEDTIGGVLPNLYDLGSMVPEITFPQLPLVSASQFVEPGRLIIGGWAEDVTNPLLQNFVRTQLSKLKGVAVDTITPYQTLINREKQRLGCFPG